MEVQQQKISLSRIIPQKLNQKQPTLQKPSIWKTLITGIVRPPRAKYVDAQLGFRTVTVNETLYHRNDHTVLHNEKFKISLTIYQPEYLNNAVILYLHGNSSSKLECSSILRFVPPMYSVAAFDFMGCGQNREVDTVSLGLRESKQVETVVSYLREYLGKYVIIWGRSMGAASALLYGKAQIIVADSSFKSLRSLCKQIAKENSPGYIPNCMINCFFPCVFSKLRKDVEEMGDYDMDQLDIKEAIKLIDPSTTLIFMSGDEDKLISSRNSQKLFDSFPGKHKFIEIFKGHHNSKRPQQTIKKVMGILHQEFIRRKDEKTLDNNYSKGTLKKTESDNEAL